MEEKFVFPRSLFDVCQAMVSTMDLEEVLDTILDLSARALEADAGSVLLYESETDRLKMLASKGLPPGVVARGYVSREGSITENVLKTNKPQIVNGPPGDEERLSLPLLPAQAIRTALCVPLCVQGRALGTLNLNRYGSEAALYSRGDLETVMILASQAAIAIENARLLKENVAQAHLAAIGQAVAGISHCVKNMLTGLRGGMGLVDMAQQAHDWEASEKGTSILRSSVERVSILVLDMLEYSKKDKVPVRRPVQTSDLFQEVLNVTLSKAEKHSIQLTTDIQEDAETICLDPDLLFRCLLNLVENAIDSMERKSGSICMGAKVVPHDKARTILGDKQRLDLLGRIFCLSVRDEGCGIPPEHMREIFNAFFSTKASKGTGLGLAVTRKIVEEHGGRVAAQSTVGEGTTFYLLIPEKDPEKDPEQTELAESFVN